MSRILCAVVSVFGRMRPKPQVGIFSVVHGKRGSLEKLGTRSADTKCAGECTCKCKG